MVKISLLVAWDEVIVPQVLALEAESLPGEVWAKEIWQAFLEQRQCLLFHHPHAFALYSWVGDEAELIKLAVSPFHRRQGLGSLLLEAGMDELRARGIQRLLLEVRASNQGAQALYRALGFHTIGIRKDYYQTPREDAWVYLREL